jgi:lipoprotein LprG
MGLTVRRTRPAAVLTKLVTVLSALAALSALSLLTACSGGGDDATPLPARLTSAKRSLDNAASIDLTLRAKRLPAGVAGIRQATGVATHAPAFRGTITIAASGLLDGQTVSVVAVDNRVYAQMPFTSSFIEVDPADFNAPDPARLMDAGTGLSTMLSSASGLSITGQEREGDQVLTAVAGKVPADTIGRIFPSTSAQQPFDATFLLDGDDRLRRAEVTGPFYGTAPAVTYEIQVRASDKQVQITPP